MCPGPWKCSPTSSPTWAPSPPNFPWFFCYFIAILQFKKAHISLFGNVPWTLKMFPNIITNSEKHPYWTFARLNIFIVGLFICICLHILSFPNNPTNKVYIMQKKTMSFGPELVELCRNLYVSQNRHVEYFRFRTIYLYLSTYIVISEYSYK